MKRHESDPPIPMPPSRPHARVYNIRDWSEQQERMRVEYDEWSRAWRERLDKARAEDAENARQFAWFLGGMVAAVVLFLVIVAVSP